MSIDFSVKPKAYSYLRFSRPEQALGDSLRRQLERARQFADERGLELDESLRDEGISAFRGKNVDDRAALGSFLRAVESGAVPRGSYLLVESLDRLSREHVLDALPRFLDLLNAGIRIVTLMDRQEYSRESVEANNYQLMISLGVMARAHEESATKGIRVQEAWEKKRQLAAVTGKAMTKICPAWMKKEGDGYTLIPERAVVVREIFELSIGGVGTRSIAKRLNSDKADRSKPFGGGRIWYDSYVKKILENPATYGEFTPRGRLAGGSDATASTTLKNYYPSVIDETTFHKAQVMMKARAASSVRSSAGKHRNVLSGLLRCQACGGGMHYIDKGKRGGRPYLQCSSSLLRAGCGHNKKHVYETLETKVVMDCSATVNEAENEKVVEVHACESALLDIRTRLERVADAIETTGLSETLQKRLATLEKDKVKAEKVLAKAKNAANRNNVARNFGVSMKEAAVLAMKLREEPENVELRAYVSNMMRSVLETITVGPARVQTRSALGFEAEENLPDEAAVMAYVNRWLYGPAQIDGGLLNSMTALPPLISDCEIQNAENELKDLTSSGTTVG